MLSSSQSDRNGVLYRDPFRRCGQAVLYDRGDRTVYRIFPLQNNLCQSGLFAGSEKYTAVYPDRDPAAADCGFLIALLFSGSGKAQILKPLYLLPYALPAAVVVIVWKVIGYYLTGQEFLVLLLCYLWKNTGYTVILWLAGIKGIQKEILEAAMVDGAGSFQRVRYIILPGLKNVFFTIVILSFLNSFKIYREAYLTAGAYPDRSIYLLQHLFNNWFVNLKFSKMAAASVLLFLVLLSGIWLLQGRWKEKEE